MIDLLQKSLRFQERAMAKKKVDYMGIPLVIEYEKGEWRPDEDSMIKGMGYPLYADYGYIEGTFTGADNEEWDVFLGPDHESEEVFILPLLVSENTYLPWSSSVLERTNFDEFKFFFGFKDRNDVKEVIHAQYPNFMIGGDVLQVMTVKGFKEALDAQAQMAEKMGREAEEVAKEGSEEERREAEQNEMYEYVRPEDIPD